MLTFPLNVYVITFLAAALAAGMSLPAWRQFAARAGLVDDPGHRKIHGEPVPLAGGLAVLTGLLLPTAAAVALLFFGTVHLPSPEALSYGLEKRALQLGAILGGAMAMVVLGILDDRFELQPAAKFLGQFMVALAVAGSGVRITLFVPSVVFSYFVTVLWILTVTNAFNFMDNMNGLCGGLGAISAWFFFLNAAQAGQYLVAMLALLIAGALLGFLPYNFPSAKTFLGDSGSHLVGYLMAVLAILPHFYTRQNPRPFAVFDPLLILAVPLLDLLCVVWIRWRLGKPFYLGDTNHLSHRLVGRGWSRSQAVLLIWLLSIALATFSLF